MKSTVNQFKSLKESLIERGESAKFFTRKTLDIILNDRIIAKKIMQNGGDVQEFYKNSETAKTDFYNKNSCSYCVLLEILIDYQLVSQQNYLLKRSVLL